MFKSILVSGSIFFAGYAFADSSQCSDTAADAAGFSAKAHLAQTGDRVSVLTSDPNRVQISDGQPLTSYEVQTTLPGENALTYLVRVNARTCRVVSIALLNR